MRIIITEQGGDLIKTLGQEKAIEIMRQNNKNNVSPKKKLDETNMFDSEIRKTGSNTMNKIVEDMKNMKNLKVIEIKSKKLSIPKNIAEKYNEIRLDETSLLPVLHKKIAKNMDQRNSNKSAKKSTKYGTDKEEDMINKMNTIATENKETMDTDPSMKMPNSLKINAIQEEDFMRTSYKMKEIISNAALDNIKSNIIYDVTMKNKLTTVVQTNFRSPFLTPDDKLIDIEFALDKKIKSDKANIIHYLNSKNSLSPKFIKSLSKYDEDKFLRLNKICQRVISQEGRDEDLKMKINGVIENMHMVQKAEYKKQMSKMESEVKHIKTICEKYPKRDNREIYENLLFDIKKKYWDKYNLHKLNKKNLKTEI